MLGSDNHVCVLLGNLGTVSLVVCNKAPCHFFYTRTRVYFLCMTFKPVSVIEEGSLGFLFQLKLYSIKSVLLVVILLWTYYSLVEWVWQFILRFFCKFISHLLYKILKLKNYARLVTFKMSQKHWKQILWLIFFPNVINLFIDECYFFIYRIEGFLFFRKKKFRWVGLWAHVRQNRPQSSMSIKKSVYGSSNKRFSCWQWNQEAHFYVYVWILCVCWLHK